MRDSSVSLLSQCTRKFERRRLNHAIQREASKLIDEIEGPLIDMDSEDWRDASGVHDFPYYVFTASGWKKAREYIIKRNIYIEATRRLVNVIGVVATRCVEKWVRSEPFEPLVSGGYVHLVVAIAFNKPENCSNAWTYFCTTFLGMNDRELDSCATYPPGCVPDVYPDGFREVKETGELTRDSEGNVTECVAFLYDNDYDSGRMSDEYGHPTLVITPVSPGAKWNVHCQRYSTDNSDGEGTYLYNRKGLERYTPTEEAARYEAHGHFGPLDRRVTKLLCQYS